MTCTMLSSVQEQGEALTMFHAANRSSQTDDHNTRFLNYFLKDFLNMNADDFVNKARQDLRWGEARIAGYFITIKERVARKEITSDSTHNYRDPIKILCDMNDVQLNWKRLDRMLPARRRRPFKGAAPSKETLRVLCSYPDRRIKAVVLTMTSAGLRVGAWDYLNVRDLAPVFIDGKVVCGKLTVYRGENEEYETFVSLEAYNALNEYLDFRKQNKEKVGPQSPLIRDLWSPADRAAKGEVHLPKRLKSTGVKRLLEDAWKANPTLRTREQGQKRFEIKATHFGRKYFETCCLRAGLEPWQIKIFRGDILPVDLAYAGFTEQERTKQYLKAIHELTIFESTSAEQENIEEMRQQIRELQAFKNMAEPLVKLVSQIFQGPFPKLTPEQIKAYSEKAKKDQDSSESDPKIQQLRKDIESAFKEDTN